MGDRPLGVQASIRLGDECIGRLMPDQREIDGLSDRFERAIVEGRPQTSRGTDHPGVMLHGGVELTHDLLGHVIDDADAADLPAQAGQFLRQPIGIGIEHTAAQNLAPHRDQLYPSRCGSDADTLLSIPAYAPSPVPVRKASTTCRKASS